MNIPDLEQIAREAQRDELPALLGCLVAAEARCRLRLTETAAPSAPPARLLDGDEGATVAGTSKRWLLAKTKGMRFRRDLSRKQPRFDEAGLRAWLAERKR